MLIDVTNRQPAHGVNYKHIKRIIIYYSQCSRWPSSTLVSLLLTACILICTSLIQLSTLCSPAAMIQFASSTVQCAI